MSDETVITMPDGGRWRPATSVDTIQCHNCDNLVDTPEEIASYPAITVTMPQAMDGGTL
jgi:hypothetical protein